jgi:peptidoglycan hydrolase-like protein with peptidoglycan-binding domain
MLEVQTLLAQRGFAVGEIDGVYGRYTKQAVIEFQKTESSLLIDGIPGRQTITLLRNIAVRQPLSNQASPNQPSPNQKTNQNVGSDSAKQTNISQPNNQQVMVVRRSPDPQVANSPQPKVDEIGNLQILLKQRGFYQGEIDGRQGQATTDALLKAQRTYGLPLNGLATPMTIRALIAANNLANGIQTDYQLRDFTQTPSSLQNAPLLPSTNPDVINAK